MITYVQQDIFDSPAHALVNAVNTVGVMGKGIAADFKKRYPEMYERYCHLCKTRELDIGKLYVYRVNDREDKLIVNFPTKKHWRNPSELSYIEDGLRNFVNSYQSYGILSVSFPQLGCGNGGLDWSSQVQPLMERYLKDVGIPVYIHVFKAAV